MDKQTPEERALAVVAKHLPNLGEDEALALIDDMMGLARRSVMNVSDFLSRKCKESGHPQDNGGYEEVNAACRTCRERQAGVQFALRVLDFGGEERAREREEAERRAREKVAPPRVMVGPEKRVRDMTREEYEEHLARFNAESEALGDDPVDYDIVPDPGFLSVGARPRIDP